MRWRNLLCLGMCCLTLATSVLAQGFRGPGPGGPRGPGFGGPGGGDPMGSVALIGIPEVQQELKLSDEQKPKIMDLLSKMQEQSRAVFEANNPFGNFGADPKDAEARFAKMRTQMEEITKHTEERLGKVLDKQQAGRFAELQLQRGGVGSLLRDEIGKQLKMSDEQRNKLRELIEQNPPFFASRAAPVVFIEQVYPRSLVQPNSPEFLDTGQLVWNPCQNVREPQCCRNIDG